jgi:hypothetical protein
MASMLFTTRFRMTLDRIALDAQLAWRQVQRDKRNPVQS